VRVIVDTNVLVSGLISETAAPARIVDAILGGQAIPVMSRDTFAELEEVLTRPRLQVYFRRAGITPFELLAALQRVATFVRPRPSKMIVRDRKDRPFLELAATSPKADFLITGDKDFEAPRYEGVTVISASLFVESVLKTR
jgi:hypothetical protein